MPTLTFPTDNNHNEGICTGMSTSWCKTVLIKNRPLKNKMEMGGGFGIGAELGQKLYEGLPALDDMKKFLKTKGLRIDSSRHRTSGLLTTKRGRFRASANIVTKSPGVYLLCTTDHSMAAAYLVGTGGAQMAFFDPNDGQYTFSKVSSFPYWYAKHVMTSGYSTDDAESYKLVRGY